MTQKFVMGVPLYRQEQEWQRQGILLSRQTMSNWLILAAMVWLMPIYDALKRWLLQHDVLHADGYDGYHKLPERITVVGCWAHLRRKFDEALKSIPEKGRAESLALVGKRYCDRLFELERNFAELKPGERFEKRQETCRPGMEEFFAWAATFLFSRLTLTCKRFDKRNSDSAVLLVSAGLFPHCAGKAGMC